MGYAGEIFKVKADMGGSASRHSRWCRQALINKYCVRPAPAEVEVSGGARWMVGWRGDWVLGQCGGGGLE